MSKIGNFTEEGKYKLALFLVVRNYKVMPVGIAKGKNMAEINKMSVETCQEIMEMIDFDKAWEHYKEGGGK